MMLLLYAHAPYNLPSTLMSNREFNSAACCKQTDQEWWVLSMLKITQVCYRVCPCLCLQRQGSSLLVVSVSALKHAPDKPIQASGVLP